MKHHFLKRLKDNHSLNSFVETKHKPGRKERLLFKDTLRGVAFGPNLLAKFIILGTNIQLTKKIIKAT